METYSEHKAALEAYRVESDRQDRIVKKAFEGIDGKDRFNYTLIYNSVCALVRDADFACSIITQVKNERAKVLAKFSQRVRSQVEHTEETHSERIG